MSKLSLLGNNPESNEIRGWLKLFFEHRFGVEIEVKPTLDGKVNLQILHFNITIQFNLINDSYLSQTNNIPCTFWNPSSEGWVTKLQSPIPAPGQQKLPSPLITTQGKIFIVNFDVLGLIYWCLTRQEELDNEFTDIYGRFVASQSHAYKYNYLNRPIVDEWLDIIKELVLSINSSVPFRKTSFTVNPMHDVDRVSKYSYLNAKDLVFRTLLDVYQFGDIKSLVVAPASRYFYKRQLFKYDPANNFDWIMKTSESFGLTSTFNFLTGTSHKRLDSDYCIDHPSIRGLIRNIHQRGHNLGVHPSFNSYQNPDIIKREIEKFKLVCDSENIVQKNLESRMHFLRWDNRITPTALEEVEVNYDGTLGYADMPGFRCGTCHDFPGFDLENYRTLKLMFKPLIAMDQSVTSSKYMNLGFGEAAHNLLIDLKNICRKFNGEYNLLWHNTELFSTSARRLYISILSD